MSAAFVDLTDYVIASEPLKSNPKVLQQLLDTTQRALTLAREQNDIQNEDDVLEAGSEHDTRDSQALPLHSSPRPRSHDISSRIQQPSAYPEMEFQANLALDSGVLGNGWFGQVPAVLESNALPPQQPLQSVDQSAFGFRLLQCTLQVAYWSLMDADHQSFSNDAWRKFRFALQFHSREEILFNLRWFLGPGLVDSARLMDISSATSSLTSDYALLNPMVDASAQAEAKLTRNGWGNDTVESFFGVKGVEDYLQQRDVQFLDSNTIELSMHTASYQAAQGKNFICTASDDCVVAVADKSLDSRDLGPHHQSQTTSPMLRAFNFNAILPGLDPTPIKTTRQVRMETDLEKSSLSFTARRNKVKVETLFRSLCTISVCLFRGPGYDRADLDQVIARAIMVEG
jgi:hypothetical protein